MSAQADLIIINGRVITMDAAKPSAEAVAISDGYICAVGSSDEIRSLKHDATHIVDAQGNTVMPGINESHIHLLAASAAFDELCLQGVKGFEALRQAVVTHAQTVSDASLLIASGADYTLLGEDRNLDRHVLDSILSDRPLVLKSPDHHTVWANTIALKQAGVLQGRQLPPGNEIVMGPDGLANGELRESLAFDDVMNLSATGKRVCAALAIGDEPAPTPTTSEIAMDLNFLRRGLSHLAKHGITSFQNMDGNRYLLELLSKLHDSGELICRGRIPLNYVSGDIVQHMTKGTAMAAEFKSEWLSSGTIKIFMDGVLDSWTALMSKDYEDKTGWRGEARHTEQAFRALCVEADRRGLQIAVHATGDGAVSRVIDGYAAALAANGARDSRHRIEHIEVVRDIDIKRMKDMEIIASMMPAHPPGQMGLPLEPTITRIGKNNWPRAYAWRAIRDAGIDLMFSSDWPVSPVSPMRSIHSAMTRKPWVEGLPDNRQTLMETLTSYTSKPAYAEFAESWKGQLKTGYVGDVVVLDADLMTIDPEAIELVNPATTICGGRITFEA